MDSSDCCTPSFGLVPGMPNKLFLIAALLSGTIAWYINKNQKELVIENDIKEKEEKIESPEKIDIDDVSDNAAVSLDLGYGLISLVDSDDKKTSGPLISKITGIRKQVSKDLGL